MDDPDNPLDAVPCICVSPTIAQCIVALGDWTALGTVRVYQTWGRPIKAGWVFDQGITDEHRFYLPKTFRFVRAFTTDELADALDMDYEDKVFLGSNPNLETLRWELNKVSEAFEAPPRYEPMFAED
jgi:hypothetical protein